MNKQSVVITGCDIVSQQILGLEELYECMQGKQLADYSREQIRTLASQLFYPNYCRRMDDFTVLGLVAAQRAMSHAKLQISNEADLNKGTVFSTEWGPIGSTFDFLKNIMTNGLRNASPFKFPYTVTNAMCGAVARTLKCGGVSSMLVGCCPINYAYHLIQNNQADCIIVGAVDDYGSLLEQIDGNNEANECFFNGAACIVMESKEYALSRNANIICEIIDAESYHLTNTSEEELTQAILACNQVTQIEEFRQHYDTDCVIYNGKLLDALDSAYGRTKVSLFPEISFMGVSSVINVCAAISRMQASDEEKNFILHSLLAKHELNSLVLQRFK